MGSIIHALVLPQVDLPPGQESYDRNNQRTRRQCVA